MEEKRQCGAYRRTARGQKAGVRGDPAAGGRPTRHGRSPLSQRAAGARANPPGREGKQRLPARSTYRAPGPSLQFLPFSQRELRGSGAELARPGPTAQGAVRDQATAVRL